MAILKAQPTDFGRAAKLIAIYLKAMVIAGIVDWTEPAQAPAR